MHVSLSEGKGQGLSSEATGVTAVVLGVISQSLGDGTNKPQPKEDLKAAQVSAPSQLNVISSFCKMWYKGEGVPWAQNENA